MGIFLEAAYSVLKQENIPLSAKELTFFALERGLLDSNGLTPWQTMKSKLSTDILRKKDKSLFIRTNKGEFGLREWINDDLEEYIADRYKKALLEEYAMVFPKESLKKYIPQSGLHPIQLGNSKELLNECFRLKRRIAEEDFSVIQLVSVFIIKFRDKYLTYKRSKRLPENRLHGSYSIYFGGHLTPKDISPLFDIFDPRFGSKFLVAELNEELILPNLVDEMIHYKGLLYDNSRPVSSQHLGIVFDVLLTDKEHKIGERGFLMDPKFETLYEINSRISDFENWSVLISNHESKNL